MQSIQEQFVETARSWLGAGQVEEVSARIRAARAPEPEAAAAASTQHVATPAAGELATITFACDVKYNFDFRRDAADFVIDDSNLVILVYGGGEIILAKFVADAKYARAALLNFAGDEVTALKILSETASAVQLGEFHPAAGPALGGPAPTLRRRLYIWARRPKNRQTLLLLIWVAMVLLLLLLTGLSVVGSIWFLGTYKPGIVLSVIFWALFFGVVILFFLPPKLIITMFGSFLGITASELGSGASLISRADNAITDMAQEINLVTTADAAFVHVLLWVFVMILTIICLPAFFRNQ